MIKGRGGRDTLTRTASARRPWRHAGRSRRWPCAVRSTTQPATISSIEIVIGTDLPDILRGDEHANTLRGGGGDDTISGRGGNDRLAGGPGRDKLRGGAGRDVLSGGQATTIWAADQAETETTADQVRIGAPARPPGASLDRANCPDSPQPRWHTWTPQEASDRIGRSATYSPPSDTLLARGMELDAVAPGRAHGCSRDIADTRSRRHKRSPFRDRSPGSRVARSTSSSFCGHSRSSALVPTRGGN